MNDASCPCPSPDIFRRQIGLLDAGARFFSAVFEEAADPMIVVDELGSVQAANAAACRLHGVDSREVLSLTLPDLVPRDVDFRSARRTLLSSGVASLEYTETNPNGAIVTTRLEGRQVQPQRYVISFHDVTKERRLEGELERAHAGTTVAHAAAAMAHDIGNLLMPILGNIDLLALAPQEDEKDSILDDMRNAAERAASLTRKLLTVARLDAETPVVLQVNDVITEMAHMLERLVAPRVAIEMRLDPALGAVEIDRERLERLLMNLVLNARDAMPEGGRIFLETANVMRALPPAQVGGSAHPRARMYATLAVIDTGPGIDATTRARIFEPFFTTKPRGGGSGLGLSTALSFVNRNRGYMDVETELGRGTSFRVGFPTPRASTPPIGESAAPRSAGGIKSR